MTLLMSFSKIQNTCHLVAGNQIMRLHIKKTPEFTIHRLVFSIASLVHEVQPEGFSVYPNPVVSQVTIKGIRGPALVYIYTTCGTLVRTAKVNGIETSVSLDLLENGLYFLKCVTGSDTFCKPIMKRDSLL